MKKRIPLFALTLALALPAWGQKHYTDITYPPLPDFIIPEAERVELDNGMILFLIEDHQLPLISMRARIGGGAVHEPAEKVGLASVTGEVMRTGGSTSMSGDEINERLERIAASVETFIGSTSGSASMSTLKEHVDEVLAIFADVLMHPAFPEDKIELALTQEKSAVSRRNDDARSIAYREFDELLYGSDHPLARSTEYATLDAIKREDIVAFHNRFFHPNNVILGVWGDFDTAKMAQRIKERFAEWPKKEDFVRAETPAIPAMTEYGVNLARKEDVTQTTILLGHPGELLLNDPDYSAVRVMNQVLSGGFSSRLFQNVRDDQGLAYSVFGSYTGSYDRPGDFYAGVMTKSKSTVEAARSVLHEIEQMRVAPPSEDEMVQAKDSYLNAFVFRFDTRSEIVSRMMTYEYYGYPKDFLHQVKSGIEAVSADDVHRVSRQYLKPDEVQILAVGNPEEFDEPLSALGPVQEIDITIPTDEEPLPEATEQTLERGRVVLGDVIEALGGQAAFDAIETILFKGAQSMKTPDNMEVSIDLEIAMQYPDHLRLTQRMPMGEFVIVRKGDTFTFPDMIPQQMHAQIKKEIISSLWRDPAYLGAHADQVDVQFLGREEFDGNEADVLQITPPTGDGFKLYVDTATMLPLALAYTRSSMGGPATPVVEALSDYREVEGVMLPFASSTTSNEQPAGTVTIESIEINAGVDASMFE